MYFGTRDQITLEVSFGSCGNISQEGLDLLALYKVTYGFKTVAGSECAC